MKWEKFQFTKNTARNAGKKLAKNKLPLEERIRCMRVLANFRSAHGYPMQSMIVHVRNKALSIDKKAIVVRRLKRIPSIINKLKRIPTMQVSTMGDIGGIRVIVSSIDQVLQLAKILENSKTHNKLIRKNDYVAAPKESGYRSIHLTYSYQGQKKDYQDLRVEIQIRSMVQHSWATAVEVVGTFSHQNLKASSGDAQWLDFFKDASKAFICLEAKQAIPTELKLSLENSIKQLKVYDILRSYAIGIKESERKDGYYLLQLDVLEKTIYARYVKPSLLLEAYEDYRRIEQEVAEIETQDVVLVSASSLNDLKKAYPNYFADTLLFIRNLNKALINN